MSGKEYRVKEIYVIFFAHKGFELQVKQKFFKWSWWDTIETDYLGIHGDEWAKHYNCQIVGKEQSCLIKS
jgi:hypothetical protein